MMTEDQIKAFLAGGGRGDSTVKKVRFPSLEPLRGISQLKTSFTHLEDIQVEIGVELGEAILKVRELLALSEGSVIKLNKTVGDAVEVSVNENRFARGEVIIVNDFFGVRINTIERSRNPKLNEGMV